MIPVLLGVGAIVGGLVVVSKWDEVTKWLEDFLPKLQDVMKDLGIGDYVAKLFSTVENGTLSLIHRLYYKENGKWIEKTTTREIDESQVPEWAKAGLSSKETDVTSRYEKELELTV